MDTKALLTDERQEILKWEYREANKWWRATSMMHRTDMAFFTATQGAVISIIHDDLLNMSFAQWLLSFIAFLVAIIGIHNEFRLYAYLDAYRKRATEIENELDMSLVHSAIAAVTNTKGTFKRKTIFVTYYMLLALGWVMIWIGNCC